MASRLLVSVLLTVAAGGACDDPGGAASGLQPDPTAGEDAAFPSRDPVSEEDGQAEEPPPGPDAGEDFSEPAPEPVAEPETAPEPSPEPAAEPAAEPAPAEPSPSPEPGGPPVSLNSGFIGGPCASDLDCGYDGGFCLTEGEAGYPAGHCTSPCDLYCPDQDGAITTFCVDPADVGLDDPTGLCHMRCDFGSSPTGCREGYKCVLLARHGEPETVKATCVPGDASDFEFTDCQMELNERGVGWTPAVSPGDHPEGLPDVTCLIEDPILVDGVLSGVSYRYATADAPAKPIFANCALAIAMDDTAQILAAQGVTDVLHFGVYNCRVIAGSNPPKLSQHGLANAIDISGIRFADGTTWKVLGDWEKGVAFPKTEGGSFLKWLVEELFAKLVFHIILTPEYNEAHKDHFHCDLTPGASFLQ